MAPVPDTLEEALSPPWLTAALSARFPGIRVTGVTPGPVVSRISTNARFAIECADPLPDGLSPYLCVKGYFGDEQRAARSAGTAEAYFYRDLAALTGVHTLHSVYADVEPETGHGVVITDDVVAAGGTFLDGLSAYAPDQVAVSLDELAALHAATWGHAGWADAPWLTSRMTRTLAARGIPEIAGNFDGPIGAGVPDEVRNAERLVATYRTVATDVATAHPWSVIHADPHIGNVFLDASGRPGFVDWQLVQRGPWYVDVGYHLAAALSVEQRRACEGDLLRHYLDRMRSHGITLPSESAALPALRDGVLHGFFLWAVTLKVDPAITTEMLVRMGTAAADHDALRVGS